jgi:hypothetical protein
MTLVAGTRRAVAVAALAAIGVTACSVPRNALGTSATPCFRALPPAEAAVHRKGRLVGVRRVTTASLRKRFPTNPRLRALTDADTNLCAFAFKGDFRPGDVDLATNTKAGTYAVVAVTSRGTQVVGASVVDRLPLSFGHTLHRP